MANTNEYIVFEADQVLTNDHLNETFNYLDQQNRWTRNKLIGIGIVCGLNITHRTGIIQISKGCGVTSQGYLILLNTSSYAYIIPYAPVDMPTDLPFTYPGNLPFYKPFCQNKTIYLLLTDNEYNGLEDAKKKQSQTLSSQQNNFLNDYVVVLFLEATETDLKNCSAFDCTNKGEKMQFNIRPLLVAKKDLPGVAVVAGDNAFGGLVKNVQLPHEIELKRFNVPYTDLKNAGEILMAFERLVDDTTLQGVANAYNFCFEKYQGLLNETTNPFTSLFKYLIQERDLILKQEPIFIEYFYDFIDDLINAYYEFCVKVSDMTAKCCPNENLFPLHLVLGDASIDTTAFTHDVWRNYFIYSPLFAKNGNETSESAFLFQRMVIMVKDFVAATINAGRQGAAIKITPSQLGYPLLSQRAIPYYYRITTGNNAIYNYWNYYKTSHGNATFNLSYNSNLYSHAAPVVHPLLYDIEHYNFFRIEGFIGENYLTVLDNILYQRLYYNLPFDVLAIPASLLTTGAKLPECNMLDLETDYKLIISELACKVHVPFCFLTKFPYPPSDNSFVNFRSDSGLQKFSSFKLAAGLIEGLKEFVWTGYVKGDFMRKYCPPAQNTIGSYYLQSLNTSGLYAVDSANFTQIGNERNSVMLVYNYIFNFINAVEDLMLLLMTNSLATLDMALLERQYEAYTKSASLVALMFAEWVGSESATLSAFNKALELDILVDEFFILSSVCIDERLQTLKDEYNRRLKLYQSQNNFLNYFKKHPGLEHKAGVPKGGTFVLVYYEAEIDWRVGGAIDVNTAGQRAVPSEVNTNVNVGQYYDIATIRLIESFVNDCKDALPAKKQTIINILNPQPGDTRFVLKNGAVIADFYIPYMCCSDCAPIAYILPKQPPTANKPVIKMATAFCDNDTTPSTINVSPTGGTITDDAGNKITGIDEQALTFTPSEKGAGAFTVIYTVNGVASDKLPVNVLATPKDNSFKFQQTLNDGAKDYSVTFMPAVADNTFTYNWAFGNGFSPSSSTDQSPVITATIDQTGAETGTFASLQVSNGNCSNPATKIDLIITGNGVQTGEVTAKPTMQMATSFCDSDTNPSPITVAPAGGKITDKNGIDINGIDNTALTFTPSKGAPGTFDAIYTVGGISSDAVTVTVLATPKENSFKFEQKFNKADNTITVKFIPAISDVTFKYKWTFGSGFTPSSSTELSPVVTVKAAEKGKDAASFASLIISNGICAGPATEIKLLVSSGGITEEKKP